MCSHHPIYYHLVFSLLVNQHKNLLMYKKLFSKGRVKYLKAGARLIFLKIHSSKYCISLNATVVPHVRTWLDPCPAQCAIPPLTLVILNPKRKRT
jgi:hypothetical protein